MNRVIRLQMIKNSAIRAEAIQILAICASTPGLKPYELAGYSNQAIVLAVKAFVRAQPFTLKPPQVFAEAECMIREGWVPDECPWVVGL